MKTFDWEFLRNQTTEAKYHWFKKNHNKPVSFDDFVKDMQKLRVTGNIKGKRGKYSRSNLMGQYKNLKKKFGFFDLITTKENNMEKAIQKAIVGGFHPGSHFNGISGDDVCFEDADTYYLNKYKMLMLPNFWQSLGKAEGWSKEICVYDGSKEVKSGKDVNTPNGPGEYYSNCAVCGADWMSKEEFEEGNAISGWLYHWHKFIDHIAEGKDIDSFFNNLLK